MCLIMLVNGTTFFVFSKLCPKGALGNVYRSNRGFPQPCLQYSQLKDIVFPMLYKLGPYLSSDPVLFVKIVRVAKGFLKEVFCYCFILVFTPPY